MLAKGVVFISIPIFSKILNPTVFGVNHEGSMLTANRLVDEGKDRVAHAVKFQSYKAETLASKHFPAYWDITKEPTEPQFELFKKHDSLWKDDFRIIYKNIETAFEILGSFKIVALADEDKSSLNAIRSLVADNDIPNGKIIERSYLTFKRPAHRISPKYIDDVVGKVAKTDIKEDDIIRPELI